MGDVVFTNMDPLAPNVPEIEITSGGTWHDLHGNARLTDLTLDAGQNLTVGFLWKPADRWNDPLQNELQIRLLFHRVRDLEMKQINDEPRNAHDFEYVMWLPEATGADFGLQTGVFDLLFSSSELEFLI